MTNKIYNGVTIVIKILVTVRSKCNVYIFSTKVKHILSDDFRFKNESFAACPVRLCVCGHVYIILLILKTNLETAELFHLQKKAIIYHTCVLVLQYL